MQDRELVAAIVAGDPEGLAEAYDRYAAPLYTYCRFMLPGPDPSGNADGAVLDTFIIAASALQGLREPGRLRPWLHAVARNECLRRRKAQGGAPGPGPDGAMPAAGLPAGLREQVLKACADGTPTGRAYRVSVTHRAGPFGRTGFPKPLIPPGPPWWHGVRRHPRASAGVTAAAAAVVVAGTVAALMIGGPHRTQASILALGGGNFGTAPGTASSQRDRRSSPSHPAAATATPASSAPGDRPTPGQGTTPGKPQPSSPSRSSSGSSPSPSPSPSSSPPPSPPPSPGTLLAEPASLALTAVKGKAVSGSFILTAVGGPVNHFVVNVPAGVATKVTVSPSAGSMPSAGAWVTVTVTVKSLVALDTHLTVNPGGLIITVLLTIKA